MKLYTTFSHRVLGLIISILLFASFALAAGDIDTTFIPTLKKNINSSNFGIKPLPDGKFYLFGSSILRTELRKHNRVVS